MKKYKVIVGHGLSIANETDCDIMTDYNPGIWGISSQKKTLQYAREYIAGGNEVTVTCYNQPQYFELANKFITELGLKQELFKVIEKLTGGVVTNGKPATLGALKRYLTVGTKIKIVNMENPDRTRETEVVEAKIESVVTKKGEGRSHLYYGKATDWTFDNTGATYNTLTREGVYIPCFTIEYL